MSAVYGRLTFQTRMCVQACVKGLYLYLYLYLYVCFVG